MSREIVSAGGFMIVLGLVGALAACSGPPQAGSDLASLDARIQPLSDRGSGRGGGETDDVLTPAQAIRQLDTIASRSLKMHVSPLSNATGALGGVQTSVDASAMLPGFTYAHAIVSRPPSGLFEVQDFSFSVETTTTIGSATGGTTGVGDAGAALAAGLGAHLVGSVPGGFTFTAAASPVQSPYLTVESAPGPPDHAIGGIAPGPPDHAIGGIAPGSPDLTLHFAIGNPNLFPDGARIHLDLGPGNSVDLVKTTDAAGVSSIAIVAVR